MAEEKKIEMELLRDYWPEDDARVAAGATISVPAEAAMDLIEKGLARRIKKG